MNSCVLDASIAVASFRPTEALHVVSRARLEVLLQAGAELVVPSIFDAEVVSALVRRGAPFAAACRAVDQLNPRRVMLGPRATKGILAVVAATQLRAADAAYVWVAKRQKLELITADAEILARAERVGVTAVRP